MSFEKSYRMITKVNKVHYIYLLITNKDLHRPVIYSGCNSLYTYTDRMNNHVMVPRIMICLRIVEHVLVIAFNF